MGFQGTKSMLWLEGQQIQPRIKVLDGPFDWQSAPGSTIPQQPPDALQASLCDIQENMPQHPEAEDELPDFTKVHYTTVAIVSTQKRATLPQNVILTHIRPATTKDEETFHQAASCTSEQLAGAWMAWAETQTHPNLSSNPSLLPTSPSLASKVRVSKLSPQSEMQAVGLDSSILSPFREPQEDQQDTVEFLPNTTQILLDPYSEEYHNALVNALKLDTELYAHVDPKLLSEF